MKYAKLSLGDGFSLRRSFLYYCQRIVTVPALRRLAVRALAAGVRARHRLPAGGAIAVAPATMRQALLDHGYVPLGQLLTRAQCETIRDHMRDKPLADRHGPDRSFTLLTMPHGVRLADYQLGDIVNCPHVLALANHPLLLDLAQRYIGCTPTISALSMRWSMPAACAGSNLQQFHRDADDWRYLKIMVYLTDVGVDEGPHVFVLGTHLMQGSARLRPYGDAYVAAQFGSERIVQATGVCGTAFAVDTAGIHKGQVPTGLARLLLQIQYSLLPAYFYEYEPVAYHGDVPVDRYINRLIVA